MNNTGQIIKSKKTRDFAIIPNSILQSSTLSLEEKGLLVYLLSLPEDWVLYKSNLHQKIGEKEGTVDRVFKLLQERGYILSVKMIGEKGRFQGWNHIVYEEPTIEELEKNPYRERVSPTPTNPDLGQSAPIQIHSLNKNIHKNTIGQNEDFDRFWSIYTRREKKKDAERSWKKLTEKEKQDALNHIPSFLAQISEKRFIPHPTTYLNQKRWQDELDEIGNLPQLTMYNATDPQYRTLLEKLYKKGYKNCSKEELVWAYDYIIKSRSYGMIPKDMELASSGYATTKQDLENGRV
jgi:hypothetical protein